MRRFSKGAASPSSRTPPRHSNFILVFLFLMIGFCALTINKMEVSKRLWSLENPDFASPAMTNAHDTEHTRHDMSDETQLKIFRENLELGRLVGAGDVSMGFKARYRNRTAIAKIAADGDLFYSDIEIDVFHVLNAPPTIPNIPQLRLAIRSMSNPFANNPKNRSNTKRLMNNLGIEKDKAKELVMRRRISVIVMDLLEGGHRKPRDLEEVQRYMKSLLETMEFVHSRNILHCDLHAWNIHWDGEMVSLFDWNGAFHYEPNKVPIHFPRTPSHLFPPEAKHNESAVHTSVHAFDVYTIGVIMKQQLKDCCGIDYNMLQQKALKVVEEEKVGGEKHSLDKTTVEAAIAYQLSAYMMHDDPYTRPTTTQALQHLFFTRTISKES